MPSKKTAPPPTGYEAYYTRDLKRSIQRHGADDLVSDIELIRYMNLLTLKRMKAEGNKLTFRDHLEAEAETGARGRPFFRADAEARPARERSLSSAAWRSAPRPARACG